MIFIDNFPFLAREISILFYEEEKTMLCIIMEINK